MSGRPSKPVVLAAVAHPDDIEFMMAGTLLLLQQAGAEIHLWNLANGCYGSVRHRKQEIIRLRAAEARAAARLAGATIHPALFDDLGIFYDAVSLARVAAVVHRASQPHEKTPRAAGGPLGVGWVAGGVSRSGPHAEGL